MEDRDSGAPWGWTRMTDRLPVTLPGWHSVELDPRTQTARYLDSDGQVVEAGKHGTSKTKGTASMSGGGDGAKPAPQRQDDTTTDYDSD
ncbi:putative ATP-grasp-modified RiPP [Actinomadura sp. LOL_016]|uniref:putative ATP-grasp-modified RiPP n=1 Tax=unclassified Actinomadura TaxID=2626254 RepID=UPI003A80BA0C